MPKTPKWAQMLGAEFSHGRRVQQLAQEEPPCPAAPSCDRDSLEPVPEHASRRRTELHNKKPFNKDISKIMKRAG